MPPRGRGDGARRRGVEPDEPGRRPRTARARRSSAARTGSRAICARACSPPCPTSCRCARPPGAPCAPRWICWRGRCCATSPASRRCSIACSTWRSCRSCASTSPPAMTLRPAGFGPRPTSASAPRSGPCTPTPAAPGRSPALADEAALSRSAFARQFTELVGLAPLAYLNDWRMALARERLRETDARLAAIATLAGLRLGVLVRRGLQAPPRRRPRTVARRRAAPSDRLDRFLIRSPARGFPS